MAKPKLEDYDAWFSIGKTPNVKTVARSALGGRILDPETGKGAVNREIPFVAHYKR